MRFLERSYKKELLDDPNIPFEDIRLNMQELNTINRLLGGHGITISGFKQILGKKKSITICEIGCGGGDNLAAIVKYCIKQHIEVNCIGIDLKSSCIEFAKHNPLLQKNTSWIISDFSLVKFKNKPDIIFSSLFCHHFTDLELIEQLKWMQENSLAGFFINDLHRNMIAYYSIKWLTQLFSSSYLVKNDAPLSVARGFKLMDWKNIGEAAQIKRIYIHWKWAFRYLLICKNEC